MCNILGMKNKLGEIRKKVGLSQQKLADLADTNYVQISRLENGGRKLSVEWAERLAPHLNVKAQDLLFDSNKEHAPLDLTMINVYDVAASAGSGLVITQENVVSQLAFKPDFLSEVTSAPHNKLVAIKINGDSMYPTLNHNDVVLVDMTVKKVGKDGVYIVQYDDGLMAKRVRVDPIRKLAIICSDNTSYPPIDGVNPDDIKIIGKVVWKGSRM